MFNLSKSIVVDCYSDADSAGLWGHENPQYPICARSRNVFVTIFDNCALLWVSKLQKYIYLYTLHSEFVALSHSVRYLFPLKSLIKEVIENSVIDFEMLKFVSSSTVYEDNNGAMVVAKSPSMTPKSNHIFFKCHWFR